MEGLEDQNGFTGIPPAIEWFDVSMDESTTDDRTVTEKVDEEITAASADPWLPAPVPMKEELFEVEIKEEFVDTREPLSPELRQGYRILKELMADGNKSVNWHFLEAVDSNHPETADYYDRIKMPIWLGKSMFVKKIYWTSK